MQVTLNESNVVDALSVRKTEVIHARAIRSVNANVTKTAPVGAKGFLWTIRLYAVTGTTPSANFNNYTGYGAAKCPFNAAINTVTAAQNNLGILWYPGTALVDGSKANALNKIVALPICSYVEFNVQISGSFAAGEGFDLDSEVTWFY